MSLKKEVWCKSERIRYKKKNPNRLAVSSVVSTHFTHLGDRKIDIGKCK